MQYNKPFDQTDPQAAYVNGNPSTNTAGSIPCAEGLEYPQREIVNAIKGAGLTPTNGDLAQLYKAMQQIAAAAAASATGSTTTVINEVISQRRIAGSTPYRYSVAGTKTLAVPAGTIFNIAECRGAGGGGAGANTNNASPGGGGGGNAAKVCLAITDVVLVITVGAGGTAGGGGSNPGSGGSGGTTSVSVQSGTVQGGDGTQYGPGATLCAATGGTGANPSGSQGLGGVASGGDLNDNGDSGGLPPYLGNGFFGGTGGASPGSGGRPDYNWQAVGNGSSAPGTGGNGSSTNGPGAPGSVGRATLYM